MKKNAYIQTRPDVVTVEKVSKRFRVRPFRPLTLKESVIKRLTRRHDPGHILWALREVSFSIPKGRAVGIIGHNGAGKTTLLRLLCGLGLPTSGRIHRAGNVGGLLELGTGFHPDMTGRENLITGGILSGLTRQEVRAKQNEIIAFSELEEFIDQPIRTYSSGMYLRLAFSTAIHFDPELLIIDEILSVGDSRFQKRCLERLKAFRLAGNSLVLASHDLDQVKNLCDEVIVLEDGRVIMQGEPESAVRCYHELMRQRTEKRSAQLSGLAVSQTSLNEGDRMGTLEAAISAVSLYDAKGEITDMAYCGDSLTIALEYSHAPSVSDMAVSLGIFTRANMKCFETTIKSVKESFGALSGHGYLRCHLPELCLQAGLYFVNVGLYPASWDYIYDYHWQVHALHVKDKKPVNTDTTGVVSIYPAWSSANIEGVSSIDAVCQAKKEV